MGGEGVVHLAGLEPATYGLEVRCSIRLSYRCIYLYRLYCTRTLEEVNVSRCYHTIYVNGARPAPP